MSCLQHPASNSKCIDCFTAEIIELTHGLDQAKNLEHRLGALAKRYNNLSLSGEAAEYCKSVIFGLNTKLIARKHALFGADNAPLIAPAAINAQHRQLYRANLRQMGTWIGITELQVLAHLFGIRFLVGFPAQPRPLAFEVGDAAAPLVHPSLFWSGNHYHVATLTPHLAGGYTTSNEVATNERGDCAFESLLLLVLSVPALIAGPALLAYDWRVRSVLRQIRSVVAAPRVDGCLDINHADYQGAIADLRDIVATRLTDAEVDDAIIAEGELPQSEEEQAAKKRERKPGSKVPAPTLSLDGNPGLPWGDGFGISAKRLGQAGMQPLRVQRLGGSVYVVGANFNASDALWEGSLGFLRGDVARKLGGAYDEASGFYTESVSRAALRFVDDEGRGMSPRSTHICSCMAAVTTRDGVTRNFLFAAVNMQPGSGDGARPAVSTLKKGESGTHSEKICLGLLAHVLRGFGLVVAEKVLAPVSDCCRVAAAGVGRAHTVTRVEVMFMNIAEMCATCEGYWTQFRQALLDAGVAEVRSHTWSFVVDIKQWR